MTSSSRSTPPDPVYPVASGYDLGATSDARFERVALRPAARVVEAAQRVLSGVNRYPDPSYAAAQRAGRPHDIPPTGSRWATLVRHPAGGGQALLSRGEVVYAWPSFTVYPQLAATSGATAIRVDLTRRRHTRRDRHGVTVATRLCSCATEQPTRPRSHSPSQALLDRVPSHVRDPRRGLLRVRARARRSPTRRSNVAPVAELCCSGPSPRSTASPECAPATPSAARPSSLRGRPVRQPFHSAQPTQAAAVELSSTERSRSADPHDRARTELEEGIDGSVYGRESQRTSSGCGCRSTRIPTRARSRPASSAGSRSWVLCAPGVTRPSRLPPGHVGTPEENARFVRCSGAALARKSGCWPAGGRRIDRQAGEPERGTRCRLRPMRLRQGAF